MNKKLKAKIIGEYETQYKFARVLNIQETVVSAVIRGRRDLDPGSRKQWARLLKCKAKDIFTDSKA